MPEPISGEIRVIVSESVENRGGSSGSTGNASSQRLLQAINQLNQTMRGIPWAIQAMRGATQYGPGPQQLAQQQTAQNAVQQTVQGRTTQKYQNQTLQMFSKYLPGLAGMFSLVQILRHSQIISTVLNNIWDILGAFVDVILTPFIPLLKPILEVMGKLIPVVAKLADKIFTPIVDALLPAIEDIANVLTQQVIPIIDTLSNILGPALKVIGDVLGGTIARYIQNIVTSLKPVLDSILIAITFGKGVLGKAKEYWNDPGKIIEDIRKLSLGDAVNLLKGILEKGKGTLELGQQVTNPGMLFVETLLNSLIKQLPGRQLGGYISETGPYLLHRGEEVITSQNRMAPAYVEIQNNFELNLAASTDINTLQRQIADSINKSLDDALRRSR